MAMRSLKVKLKVADPSAAKLVEEAVSRAEGFSLQAQGETGPADLVILEIGMDPKKDIRRIYTLLREDRARDVIAISQTPSLMREAFKAGAIDFLHRPEKAAQVVEALKEYRERRPTDFQKRGQVINVIGSKGGIGTTTIAVNLATTIARKEPEHAVALVDLSRVFGEVGLFLEIKPEFNLGDVTKHASRLDGTFLQNTLTRHSSGLSVLCSPTSLNGKPAPTPEAVERLITLMRSMFDIVIFDGGFSLDNASLRSIEMSDRVLILSLLNLPCLHNASRIIHAFREWRHVPEEHVAIVINRYLKKSEISLKDAEKIFKKEIFWTVPNDYKATMSAISRGKTLSEVAPRAPITKNIHQLMDALLKRGKKEKKRRWKLFP
jgi:pilus assembly protein CpaE